MKTNYLLVEKEFKKETKFRDKSHFEEDCTQNYLVFQPMYRYLKRAVNSDYVLEW